MSTEQIIESLQSGEPLDEDAMKQMMAKVFQEMEEQNANFRAQQDQFKEEAAAARASLLPESKKEPPPPPLEPTLQEIVNRLRNQPLLQEVTLRFVQEKTEQVAKAVQEALGLPDPPEG